MASHHQDTKLLSSLDHFEHVKLKGKDRLGKGSFASVRLVRHKQTGQYYALKEVSIHFCFRSSAIDRFKYQQPLEERHRKFEEGN